MNLLDLPPDCIAHILSLTSPLYALRSSTVCKLFNSVLQSDLVWEKFLPFDYQYIVDRSPSSSELHTKKDIVLRLCSSFILLDDGHKSFSLDKWTGKKCYFVGARELSIESGHDPRCWRWKSLPESRFPEVAELVGANDLLITAGLKTHVLSPDTTYRMYFCFKLGAWSRGFDAYPVTVVVQGMDSHGLYLGGDKYNVVKSFYLKAPESNDMPDTLEGEYAFEHRRDRGHKWIKIDMGKYYNEVGVRGAAAVLVMTVARPAREDDSHISGLIVHGMEILPVD